MAADTGSTNSRREWKVLGAMGIFCLALQLAAVRFVPSFETPNASLLIARNLAEHGSYGCNVCWSRLHGPDAGSEQGPLRMFHLPGEPLLLAASFRFLPPPVLHYIHIPVTVLLLMTAVYWGLKLGGAAVAITTGVVASLQPFILLHGPVWDDTFLSAALE